MRGLLLLVTVVLASGLGGCATIISGTEQAVDITSQPAGAKVVVDGSQTYQTPVKPKLSRKSEHEVLISHPGYHSERIQIRKTINGAVLGNILIGGVVGGVADVASGAAMSLTPKDIHVDLVPVARGESATVREWTPPKKNKQKDEEASTANLSTGKKSTSASRQP